MLILELLFFLVFSAGKRFDGKFSTLQATDEIVENFPLSKISRYAVYIEKIAVQMTGIGLAALAPIIGPGRKFVVDIAGAVGGLHYQPQTSAAVAAIYSLEERHQTHQSC